MAGFALVGQFLGACYVMQQRRIVQQQRVGPFEACQFRRRPAHALSMVQGMTGRHQAQALFHQAFQARQLTTQKLFVLKAIHHFIKTSCIFVSSPFV